MNLEHAALHIYSIILYTGSTVRIISLYSNNAVKLQKLVTVQLSRRCQTSTDISVWVSCGHMSIQMRVHVFVSLQVCASSNKVNVNRSDANDKFLSWSEFTSGSSFFFLQIRKLCGIPYHTARDNRAPVQSNDPVCLLTSEVASIPAEESHLVLGRKADKRQYRV